MVGATNLFNACCFSNSPSHFPQETNGARHLRKVHASKKVSTATHSIVRGMFHIVLNSYKRAVQQALPLSKLCFVFFLLQNAVFSVERLAYKASVVLIALCSAYMYYSLFMTINFDETKIFLVVELLSLR